MTDWLEEAKELLSGTDHPIANAANLAALIYEKMEGLNWAGFYFMHEGRLLLGPFVGKPACISISLDRGVCGAAARTGTTQRVADVHKFPGHIACDSASQSELVTPIVAEGRVIAVMDLDSTCIDRFSAQDQADMEVLARIYAKSCDWRACGYTL